MPDQAHAPGGYPITEEDRTAGYDPEGTDELAQLRAKVAEYEDAINWGTSCLSCSRVLDSAAAETFRRERAEKLLAAAGELAAQFEREAEEMRAQSIRDGLHPALAGGHREANLLRQCAARLSAAVEPSAEGGVMAPTIDLNPLAATAREIQAALRANRANGLTDDNALLVTLATFAEEAGELAGAIRRYSGHARRSGTLAEVSGEVADVLIGAAILAELLDIDISEAVTAKVKCIFSRGWKEPAEVPS